MKIDRNNYEEYFILYLDNELSAAERLEVEAFAKAHPDLQEELDILLQSKLVPDQHIVFENKEELFSIATNTNINISNYEEWLVLYTDNELNNEQRAAVEQFAANNPSVQNDLKLLLQTKAAPDMSVVFPDKASLYRREEKTRPFIWWRIAAAAAIVVAIATTAVIFVNNRRDTVTSGTEGIAGTGNTPGKTDSKENNEAVPAINSNNTSAPLAQDNIIKDQQKNPGDDAAVASTTPKKNTGIKKQQTNTNALLVKAPLEKDDPVVADNTPRNMIDNNSIAAVDVDKITTSINADKQSTLTNSNTTPAVTSLTPKPLDKQKLIPTKFDEAEFASNVEESDGKKSRLRGFLRKVTRTFEKKTNIDATDDDDRLLVGGLAFKLK
jgi:hypothetical protein